MQVKLATSSCVHIPWRCDRFSTHSIDSSESSDGQVDRCSAGSSRWVLPHGGPSLMRCRPSIVVVLCALAVAACSSSDPSESLATSTTEAVTTTDPSVSTPAPTDAPTTTPTVVPTLAPEPTEAPEDEPIETVIAGRIRGFFDAREAANAGPVPDPADPALAEVAAGEALASAAAETQRRLDDGRAIRAGEQALAEIWVGSVRLDDDTAQAAACSVDDGVIYEVATGDVVNDDVVTHSYVVDLQLSGDAWKVIRVVRLQQWEGVAGCALARGDFPF